MLVSFQLQIHNRVLIYRCTIQFTPAKQGENNNSKREGKTLGFMLGQGWKKNNREDTISKRRIEDDWISAKDNTTQTPQLHHELMCLIPETPKPES